MMNVRFFILLFLFGVGSVLADDDNEILNRTMAREVKKYEITSIDHKVIAKIISVELVDETTLDGGVFYSTSLFESVRSKLPFMVGTSASYVVKMILISAKGEENIFRKQEEMLFSIKSPIENVGYPAEKCADKEVSLLIRTENKRYLNKKKNNTFIQFIDISPDVANT